MKDRQPSPRVSEFWRKAFSPESDRQKQLADTIAKFRQDIEASEDRLELTEQYGPGPIICTERLMAGDIEGLRAQLAITAKHPKHEDMYGRVGNLALSTNTILYH